MHRDSPPPLEYELVRSRRRSLEVRVRLDGSVQVRAPLKLAAYRVEAFVDSRRDWIRDQQQRMAARPRVRWRDGDACQYLGAPLTLRVAAAGKARVARHGDERTARGVLESPELEPAVHEQRVATELGRDGLAV